MELKQITKMLGLALLASSLVVTHNYALDMEDPSQEVGQAIAQSSREYKLGREVVSFSEDLIDLSELFTTMAKDKEEGILEFPTTTYIRTLGFTLNDIHELLQKTKDESLDLENTKIRKLFKIAELANFINCPSLLNPTIDRLADIAEKKARTFPEYPYLSGDSGKKNNYSLLYVTCNQFTYPKVLNPDIESLICTQSCFPNDIAVKILYFLAYKEMREEMQQAKEKEPKAGEKRNALLCNGSLITTAGAAVLYKRAAIKDLSINLLTSCKGIASWTLGTISSSLSVAKDRLVESRVSNLDYAAHKPKKLSIILGAGCIGAGLMYATRKEIAQKTNASYTAINKKTKQIYRELSQNTFLGPLAAMGVATVLYLGAKNTSMMLYPKKS